MTTTTTKDNMTTTRTESAEAAPEKAGSVEVTGFVNSDAADWDRFVEAHEHGTVFHTLRWRDVIRHTFKHDERFLVAPRGGRITGILPIFDVSSFVFGRTLVSVPFGV